MTTLFRAQFVLTVFNRFGFGEHVTDPNAFTQRANKIFRKRKTIKLKEDPEWRWIRTKPRKALPMFVVLAASTTNTVTM